MGYKYKLLHFLPFILTYCLFLPFFFLSPDQRILVYQNEGKGYEIQVMILLLLIVVSGIVYVSLSLWLLKKHKKIVSDQFSSADKINLAWLRYLIYGIGVIWLFVLFDSDPMIFNSVVVFVFFLGYFGIKQVGIFTQVRSPDNVSIVVNDLVTSSMNSPDTDSIDNMVDDTGKGKYLRSSLSKVAANEIHTSLTKAMEVDKLFTNPELTLSKLSETLDVHPHNLSQVINTFEGMSFYDYINHQRIIEFKRIAGLPESRKYTLLSLAHDCGFNSKTSFNRNFKNATGLSPSEYLSQTRIQLEV
jgi:AraC-like DNA-binding protein